MAVERAVSEFAPVAVDGASPVRIPPLKRMVSHLPAERLTKGFSVLALIGAWYLAAALLPANIMPAPHLVVQTLWAEMRGGPIWSDVAVTLTRLVNSFVIAMGLSILLGFAMGVSRTASRFLDIWIICGMTIPSLVLILTVYMVVGLNDRAAVIAAALPVVPILTINIWDGIKSVDQKLIDMAKAYHAGQGRIIRSVIAPQIAPVMLASARFGLGLIWKMVLFVELLGRSDGVGYKIEYYYQMFNMAKVLAYSLLFLFIMLFIEMAALGALERRLFKWRPAQRRI
jgi:NitT/TauT family transport system permease protein